MSVAKNVLLKIKQNGQIYDLFVKTNANNVIVDKKTGETLRQRLNLINEKLASTNTGLDEKIAEVKAQVTAILKDAPEAMDSLKEIADYLQNHTEEFEALRLAAEGIHEALQNKIGNVPEGKTVKEYVDEAVAAARVKAENELAAAKEALESKVADEVTRASAAEGELAGQVSAEVTRAKAAEKAVQDNLDAEVLRAQAQEAANAAAIANEAARALAAEVAENTRALAAEEVEKNRAEQAEADLSKKLDDLFVVFDDINDFNSEAFGDMACIFLPDDPTVVESETELVEALQAGKDVELASDIVLTAPIGDYEGTIDLNGYELRLGGAQ